MKLSSRLPSEHAPNAWARSLASRRASGARLLDLTESNPTRVGLGGADSETLTALADPAGARYEPDPRGNVTARAALAGYYASRGLEVSPDDLFLTSSTSEAYAHIFRLLGDPGDMLLAPAPSYPLFEPIADLEGLTLEHYRLEYDGGWQLDRGSLERCDSPRARAVIVVQPNHPTGSCLSRDEIAAVETHCERRGLALIADEVFGDVAWRGGALPSLLGASRVPTFVLGGLSKLCGMPQLKLAWVALAGPPSARAEVRRALDWIGDLFLSVSTPVHLALPRLLETRRGFQEHLRERLSLNLACVRERVRRQPALELLSAHGGWSAVLRVPRRMSEEEWALALLERDVVVHPGHFYDFASEAYLVVSLIVEPAVMEEGMARLEALAAET